MIIKYKGGVYEIVNTVTGKRYIGSAAVFKRRLSVHRQMLAKGNHPNIHLQRAWNKDGEVSFRFTPLLICDKKNLLFYEQRVMDGFQPEYNIARVAGSSLGLKRSVETKARISVAKAGKKLADGGRNSALARIGMKFTPERCANISAAKRGKKFSAEHCRKLSEARRNYLSKLGDAA